MANLIGKHCYQSSLRFWNDHIWLVWAFYLHLIIFPFWCTTKLDLPHGNHDQPDAYHVFLFTWLEFSPVFLVPFDSLFRFFQWNVCLFPHPYFHLLQYLYQIWNPKDSLENNPNKLQMEILVYMNYLHDFRHVGCNANAHPKI